MKRHYVIGTRESKLAMWQARFVQEQLAKRFPSCEFSLKGIKTKGDKILDVALAKIGDKGLFTKEIEQALLVGEIDLAVHSMKDLPTALPKGLTLGAICPREYPGDVLVSRLRKRLDQLPEGSIIGTSSLRRAAQLLAYRPDLQIVPVRGNVETRLRRMEENGWEGIVLAFAGLNRLGLTHLITERLSWDIMLPAAGQGSIGVEIRDGDREIQELVSVLDDREARLAITAERAFLRRLEGGCQIPIGVLGMVENGKLQLRGVIASLDGKKVIRSELSGQPEEAEEVGRQLAENMLAAGADVILAEVRGKSE